MTSDILKTGDRVKWEELRREGEVMTRYGIVYGFGPQLVHVASGDEGKGPIYELEARQLMRRR